MVYVTAFQMKFDTAKIVILAELLQMVLDKPPHHPPILI
mgnify:CR=1 FL=1